MKNLSMFLVLSLTGTSILGFSKDRDGAGKLSNEERAAQEAKHQKDLANPDVDAVKITDHFKKVQNRAEHESTLLKEIFGEGVALGFVATEVVIRLSKKTDEDKIIRKFVKKGFNVTAKAARVYLISDAVTKCVLRFQDLDPTITALPGATAWAVREAHEFALEAPELAKRIPGAVHESVKGVIKSVKGQANE